MTDRKSALLPGSLSLGLQEDATDESGKVMRSPPEGPGARDAPFSRTKSAQIPIAPVTSYAGVATVGEQPSFLVRAPNRRPLGPMPRNLLVDLVTAGRIDAHAEVRLADQTNWTPIHAIPELTAALQARAKLAAADEAEGLGAPLFSLEIGPTGALPTLLSIAQAKHTGWLTATRGEQVHVVTFRGGRITHVRAKNAKDLIGELLVENEMISRGQLREATDLARELDIPIGNALVDIDAVDPIDLQKMLARQAQLRLAEVLAWTEGNARFDVDPSAVHDEALLAGSVADLCRQTLVEVETFDLDRALAPIDAPELVLDVAHGHVPKEGIPPDEVAALATAEGGATLQDMLARLEPHLGDRRRAQRAIYLLVCLGLLSARRSSVDASTRGFVERVMSPDRLKALEVPHTSAPQIMADALQKLRARAEEVFAEIPPTDRVRTAVFARIDDIERRIADPFEVYVLGRASFMGLDPDDELVRKGLENEYLGRVVGSGVAAGNYAEVAKQAERHLEIAPKEPLAIAHAHLVRLFLAKSDDQKKEACRALIAAAHEMPNAMELQVACAKACISTNRMSEARAALRAAEKINISDPRLRQLYAQLQGERRIVQALKKEAQLPPELPRVAAICLTVFVAIGIPGVLFKLGFQEHTWSFTDPFFYVRRALLVAGAFIGWRALSGDDPGDFFRGLFKKTTSIPLLVALVFGVGSGLMSPTQTPESPALVLLGLVLVHVLAEQLFFIGFVARGLMQSTAQPFMAAVWTAVFFALYRLTEAWPYMGIRIMWIPLWLATFALAAGLPYALLYTRTRSIVPALLCQLVVVGTMMLASLLRGG